MKLFNIISLISGISGLSRRARGGVLYLDEFQEKARKIAFNYLSPIQTTKTKCNKHLELDKDGRIDCYAFSAGDPTKPIIDETYNPGNIAKNYFNKNVSILSALYYSETNKFIVSSLRKQAIDHILVVSDKNPACEIVQFKSRELEETQQGAGSVTITETTAKRMTKGFITGGSIEYTTPFGDYLPSFSLAATHSEQDSVASVMESSVGQTFFSSSEGSCTPYSVAFGIWCQSADIRKIMSVNGKVKKVYKPVSTPKREFKLMPVNAEDLELFSLTVGCVELNTKGRS